MAERSVHEAAVDVMAGALCWHTLVPSPCDDCIAHTREQIAALVASAEVRAAFVDAIDPHRLDEFGECECGWRQPNIGRPPYYEHHVADTILAALAGPQILEKGAS